MCFVWDSDWSATVSEESDTLAAVPTKCDECRAVIPPGAFVHHIYQQEHEECYACEWGECECPGNGGDHECECAKPAYGETFTYDRCQSCDNFLKAVEAAELVAGCAKDESRPPLGQMHEYIGEGGRDEAKKYWQTAVKMFPEMKMWLGEMWNRLFV